MANARKQPLDHLRSLKAPTRQHVWIIGDNELADELVEAREQASQLKARVKAQAPDSRILESLTRASLEADEEVKKIETALRKVSLKFVFQAMGRKQYSELMDGCPPTDEQIAEAAAAKQDKPPFDQQMFPKLLVGYSMLEPLEAGVRYPAPLSPEMLEFVADIFDGDTYNDAEVTELFMQSFNVNQTKRNLDLGKG